jgi:hypothetical protein
VKIIKICSDENGNQKALFRICTCENGDHYLDFVLMRTMSPYFNFVLVIMATISSGDYEC